MFPRHLQSIGLVEPKVEAAGIEPAQDSPGLVDWFYGCVQARAEEMFEGRFTRLYFIEDEASRAVKIGIADNVPARLAGLQSANPNELTLLVNAPSTRAIEKLVHAVLLKHRIRGEWFHLNDVVLEFADAFDELWLLETLADEPTLGWLEVTMLEIATEIEQAA